jgi:hypothetical protein
MGRDGRGRGAHADMALRIAECIPVATVGLNIAGHQWEFDHFSRALNMELASAPQRLRRGTLSKARGNVQGNRATSSDLQGLTGRLDPLAFEFTPRVIEYYD